MPIFSEFLNQRVVVIFNDGEEIRRKEGVLKDATPDGITLLDSKSNTLLYLPMPRIIKIEKTGVINNE
jgi:hypothetical protein